MIFQANIYLELRNDTTLFGKVYLTIFQSKRRRLVFKTGIIMYIQIDTKKVTQKHF